MNKNLKTIKSLAYIGIPVFLALLALRFTLFYYRSDGLSGLSVLFPLLVIGTLLSALLMSVFFAAWVFEDCKKRSDDGILWAFIVIAATPFLGLLIYFLRRSEVKKKCAACGHPVSLKAKYCEECGSKIEIKEEYHMEMKRTHHTGFIFMGVISMVVMVTCLTVFIVSAAAGNGINTDVSSGDKVWNLGGISMNYDGYLNGVWTLDFKRASSGYIAEEKMTIHNAESETLYADITCGSVPEDASLTLYLVQDDMVKTFDVTNLSEPLACPLKDFRNGKIRVRLLIEGVKDTVSEIYID